MPAEQDFSIETQALDRNITVVKVAGFLDAHTFETLEEEMAALFGKKLYRVIVDLSKVQYISSAGAGVFIGALSEAQEHSGDIVLMSPTNNVREVFDLLGLTQIFRIVYDLKSAQSAFAG
jgi:anti-sigma B factor antagonist